MSVRAIHRTIEREESRGKVIMERTILFIAFSETFAQTAGKPSAQMRLFIAFAQSGGTAPPARCGTSSTHCRRDSDYRRHPAPDIGLHTSG